MDSGKTAPSAPVDAVVRRVQVSDSREYPIGLSIGGAVHFLRLDQWKHIVAELSDAIRQCESR